MVRPPIEGSVLRTRFTPGKKSAWDVEHYCLTHYPYDKCVGCLRKMRPHGTMAKDWPGTLAKGSAEACSSCHEYFVGHGKYPSRR